MERLIRDAGLPRINAESASQPEPAPARRADADADAHADTGIHRDADPDADAHADTGTSDAATPTPTPTPASIATPTPTPTPASIATPTPTPTPASIAPDADAHADTGIHRDADADAHADTGIHRDADPDADAHADTGIHDGQRRRRSRRSSRPWPTTRSTEIVVANGTYHVSTAGTKAADSLWIGARFAGRTRPILVRAETTGGVTFDGGGTTYFGGISFQEGAHDQTWQGFTFAHGEATSTGVIMFGGYAGSPGAHHITLRDITIAGSCTSLTGAGVYHDHAVYISYAVGGVHDILIDGLTVDGSGGLDSAINFGHYDPTGINRNAWNFIVRNMHVTGTQLGIVFWDGQGGDITVEDSTITNATVFAVRYETTGKLTLRRVVSTNSGGFYSSLGANPPGVTFDNVSLR